MSTIQQLTQRKTQRGDVGVEIEVEGIHLQAIDNAVWRSEDDGSLRGRFPDTRCEYIFQVPIPVKAVKGAVDDLKKELQDHGSVFQFSYRCSVHVHVNVQKLEYEAALAMMYTYYLLEEPLINFAGKKRKGNNFCLRLADAEGVLDTIKNMVRHGEQGLHIIPRDHIRYSAMNLEALNKYGSIEFRAMEGNMDGERISTWCKALVNVRDFAVKMGSIKAVYDLYNSMKPIDFMKEVLGDMADKFTYNNIDRDMAMSYSLSLDLPFINTKIANKATEKLEIGDIVDYKKAVALIAMRGGVQPTGDGLYIVVETAKKKAEGLAIKKPVLAAELWQQAHDPVQMIIDELPPAQPNELEF